MKRIGEGRRERGGGEKREREREIGGKESEWGDSGEMIQVRNAQYAQNTVS